MFLVTRVVREHMNTRADLIVQTRTEVGRKLNMDIKIVPPGPHTMCHIDPTLQT